MRTNRRSAKLPFALVLAAGVALASALAAGGARATSETPSRFPHDMHVEDQEMACTACHAPSEAPEEEVGLPSPEACADCHEPSDVAAFFPLGSYHPDGWQHAHQYAARTQGMRGDCTTCHTGSETCLQCHEGENLDLLAHERNYLFDHAVEARHSLTNCASCHDTQSFCTECHAAEGVLPGSHRLAGWARGPVHGAEAKRDVEYCAACHGGSEPVCFDCHDDR